MNYYTINKIVTVEQQINALVTINPSHAIFEGHFPGMPILPGACQVQMISQILAKATEQPVQLEKADNIKFMAMVNPFVNPDLTVDIKIKTQTEEALSVSATMAQNDQIVIKFSGKFKCNPSHADPLKLTKAS